MLSAVSAKTTPGMLWGIFLETIFRESSLPIATNLPCMETCPMRRFYHNKH
jgi:hypothetical protein